MNNSIYSVIRPGAIFYEYVDKDKYLSGHCTECGEYYEVEIEEYAKTRRVIQINTMSPCPHCGFSVNFEMGQGLYLRFGRTVNYLTKKIIQNNKIKEPKVPVYLIKLVEQVEDNSGDYTDYNDQETVIGYYSGSKEELEKLIEKQEEKIEEAKANYFDWSFKRRIYFDEIKETQENLEKSILNAREERRNLFASLLETSRQDEKAEELKKISETIDKNDQQLTLLYSDLSKMEKTDHESRLKIFLDTNPEPKNYPNPTHIDFEELKEFKGL